jgi:hypothetical protein
VKISVLIEALTARFETDTNRAAKNFNRRIKSMEREAQKAGRLIGGALGGLSAGFLARQVIRNTAEAERVTAKLNQTLVSTGRYSDETSQALLKQASALQQATTYGDEAIVNAQAQLLTFTRLGSEVFPRATEAVLNLSTTMDQDLRTSVIAVGKALNDPITGMTSLARAGIQFTKQQKEQAKALVESGQLIEAQNLILKELETQFGGSARAARDTFGGAMAGVQNAVGDLLEADGDSLPGVTKALNDLTDTLNSQEVKQGFQYLTSASITLVGWLAKLASGFAHVGTTLGEEFAIALNGGIPALDDFKRRAEQIVELERQLAEHQKSLQQAGMGQGSPFARAVREDIAALQEKIRVQRDALTGDLQDFGLRDKPKGSGAIPGLDSGKRSATVEFDMKGLDAWIAKAKQAEDAAREAAETAAGDLANALNSLTGQMGGPTAEAGNRLAETFLMLADRERVLAETGQLTLERQQQLISARSLATQQYLAEMEEIEQKASGINELQEEYASIVQSLQTPIEEHAAYVQRIVDLYAAGVIPNVEAYEQALARANERFLEANEKVSELDEFGKEAARGLQSSLSDLLFDPFDEGLSGMAKSFAATLQRMAAEAAAAAILKKLFGGDGAAGVFGSEGFGDFISGIFSGKAAGGPVYGGVPYLVGEKGPEIVVPGGSGTVIPNHMLGGGNSQITNVFNLPPTGARLSEAQLAQELQMRQSRALGRNR